jgi:hypothetical protein
MNSFRTVTGSAALVLLASFCVPVVVDGARQLDAKPGVFESRKQKVATPTGSVTLTLSQPTGGKTPPFVVFFASGDGGLGGVSKATLQHLAERGYWTVGFSSPEAFKGVVDESNAHPNYGAARDRLRWLIAEGKRALQLPDQIPVILTGMSRGANVVIAGAGDPTLNHGIIGAVAIALTREFDDLTLPESAQQAAGVTTDNRGRIQTYAAIERLGSMKLAVIQSTNDKYVKSAESRRLLGPDTPTRRLYEVESSNHSFGGGVPALMRDLDDAMAWITGTTAPGR